jgi:sRNA-binding protein
MIAETALGAAFKVAVESISKKKQIAFITHHLYSKYNVFSAFYPLAIGIDKAVISAMPQFDETLILRALANHCHRPRYIKSLARGGNRYDLWGKPKGEVTSEEQKIATDHLLLKKQLLENNT